METLMEQKLTKAQTLMVIEYFAQQAAETLPDTTDWKVWERHLWLTMYQTSIAIERQIKANDWDTLVNAQLDLQSFDRDPKGFMYERGESDWGTAIDDMDAYLKQQVSWGIDNVLRNSGA